MMSPTRKRITFYADLIFKSPLKVAARLLLVAILASPTLIPSTSYSQATKLKSIPELKVDLAKIEKSIKTTRENIKKVRDARFLPELYFALAELHVEKARYLFTIKSTENRDVDPAEIDFTEARKVKQQSIEIYQGILDKFPQSTDRDKALFYMAHEYRELGQMEQMAQTYARITNEFPTSKFWEESQLILGNYYNEEKKDFDFALEMYSRILKRKATPFTPLARYKMGWIYINQDKFKDALMAFENIMTKDKDIDFSTLPEIYRKNDVKRDALTAVVWPYSEMEYKDLVAMGEWRTDPLKYISVLAPDKASYLIGLRRLGNRMVIKKKYILAVRSYFELLKLSNDLDAQMEAIENIYQNMKESEKPWPVTGYVKIVAEVLNRIKYSNKVGDKELKALEKNYEIYARDVATRFQKQYNQTGNADDAKLAINAYENYLWAFPESKFRGVIRLNLAETQFKTKKLVQAGVNYETLGQAFKIPARRKSMYDSALQAFSDALKSPKDLSRLELTEARNGIRSVGREFIKSYSKDKAIASIRFVIGRTYYDERNFPRAVKAFNEFIKAHPNSGDVQLAVDLILDSFNQREDYDGLIKAGTELSKNTKIAKSIRDNASEIAKQAQFKKIQAQSGDFSSPSYTKNLLKFAAQYKGSDLGDQALYEAFLQLKSKKDPRAYVPGEQLLLKYGNSKYAKEVVNQMGQMALISADFRRAARYFEAYHQRYPGDAQAKTLLEQAATFREYMGDFKEAADNYGRLGNSEGVARTHFLSANWRDLAVSSARVGGLKGAYWAGLSRYRVGDVSNSIAGLQRAATAGAITFEEKTMAAHSLYLIASQAVGPYKAVQIQSGQEAQAVQMKAQMLKNLEAQMNKVIQFGNGRWTIAALYTLGVVNQEFGKFILDSPTPAGLSGLTLKQFRDALAAEAKKYQTNASNYFKQCLSTGEKFEVFTQFMKGCLSNGGFAIDETRESLVRARASESTPAQADAIRVKLFDDTRNTDLFLQLADSYTQNGDYSMAILILQRASEVNSRDARIPAAKGMNFMFMNELDGSRQEFDAALKISSNEPTALWGKAALYNEFGFKSKAKGALAKAKASGNPRGRLHPFVSSIR